MNPEPLPGKASQRFVETCAATAGAVAVAALLGWVFGDRSIAALGPDYIPTAPSTAGLMMMLGGGVFLRSYSPARSITTAVALLAVFCAVGMSLLVWTQTSSASSCRWNDGWLPPWKEWAMSRSAGCRHSPRRLFF